MLTLRRPGLVATAFVLTVMATACGDGDDAGSSTPAGGAVPGDEVVLGAGELPETIPADFPLPPGSSVGSTMVINSSGFTEVVTRSSAGQAITVRFFEEALVEVGFTVTGSSAEGTLWIIEFSRGGAKGTIEISEPTLGISQAVIRYNVP